MLPGKKVAVLGLGRSGYEAARWLAGQGYEVFVSEHSDRPEMRLRAEELRACGIVCETGTHSPALLDRADWFLLSPAISPRTGIYQALVKSGRPRLSEIEAAYRFCKSPHVIAVTGTSGKTTVTTLIARVLERAGFPVVLCGNIGNPWIGELEQIGPETRVVLELSSFQLQHCESFRPSIGALLNISPNHFDWHSGMGEYAGAKWNLFRRQKPSDIALFRKRDFSAYPPGFPFRAKQFDLDEAGSRNANEHAVRMIASLLEIGDEIPEAVFRDFRGLEHRMEDLGEADGVRYINDSKSTTPASLAWALKQFSGRSVILIAGGIAKSGDHASLCPEISRKVRQICLYGRSSDYLLDSWKEAAGVYHARDLREAFSEAVRRAEPGDCILFSPACSSFDMFQNYMERGKAFKTRVQGLTEKKVKEDSL